MEPQTLVDQEYIDTLGEDTGTVFCGTCGEPCKISKKLKESYLSGYTYEEEIWKECPASECCGDYVYSARFWNPTLLQWDFEDTSFITEW